MHICLGNYYADNFGYQENLITKYHKRDGFEVSILASRINFNKKDGSVFLDHPREYVNDDGISVKRIDYRFSSNKLLLKICQILKMYKGVSEHLEDEMPDIIFLHNAQFLDVYKVLQFKKKNPKVKIYADNHGDLVNSARNFLSKYILHGVIWRVLLNRLEPYCEKFWGVTPNRCDFLTDVYKIAPNKVGLLPLCADSENIHIEDKTQIRDQIRKRFQIAESDFLLITGGKIDEKKKTHNLIEAIVKLDDPALKLLVIGVPDKEMKSVLEKYLNSELIKMAGWVEADTVYDYFLASDLGVFPGTHSVLWEQAVGSGLPCIFKKWPGMTHVDVGGNCISFLIALQSR